MHNKITTELILNSKLNGEIDIPVNYEDTICNFIDHYRYKIDNLYLLTNFFYNNNFFTDCQLLQITINNLTNLKKHIRKTNLKKFKKVLKFAKKYSQKNKMTKINKKIFYNKVKIIFESCKNDLIIIKCWDFLKDMFKQNFEATARGSLLFLWDVENEIYLTRNNSKIIYNNAINELFFMFKNQEWGVSNV